jgi:hypothetical protein
MATLNIKRLNVMSSGKIAQNTVAWGPRQKIKFLNFIISYCIYASANMFFSSKKDRLIKWSTQAFFIALKG